MARKIVGIGETVLDIVFRCGKPQAGVPGGSTFNAMISLGRTVTRKHPECKVEMITQVGSDAVADIVTDFMGKNGVCTDGVKRIEGTQSVVSLAILDENNDAHYEFFRDKSVPPFKANEIEFSEGDIVVFGSFFAINKTSREETQMLIRKAKAAGAIVYYDINFRKSHLLDLPETKPFIMENCSLADVVRGSHEDINYIFGSSDPVKVYAENMSKLCTNFICTKGKKPTEVFSADGRFEFDPGNNPTVSTIGAGDNFNAGFVYGLIDGGYTKAQVASLKAEDWNRLVPVASRFAGHVCGSIYNYVDEDFYKTL